MAKATITRKKTSAGDAIVEVDGIRVGTARRCKAAMGSPAWWTLFLDEVYRTSGHNYETCADAKRVREAAEVHFKRAQPQAN